jgi:uncharacterized protein YkvS
MAFTVMMSLFSTFIVGTSAASDLNVRLIEYYDKDTNHQIRIYFNKAFASAWADVSGNTNITDYIKLNNKTMTTIITENPGKIGMYTDDTGIHTPADCIDLMIDKSVVDFKGGTSGSKMDVLEFIEGLVSPVGDSMGSSIGNQLYARTNNTNFTILTENDLFPLSVSSVTVANGDASNYVINVDFNKNIATTATEVSGNTNITNYIKINGKTLAELKDLSVLTDCYVANWDASLNNRLQIRLKKANIPQGVTYNNIGDVVEVENGLTSVLQGIIKNNQKFIRKDATDFLQGLSIKGISMTTTETDYDIQLSMYLDIPGVDTTKAFQDTDIANYIKINGNTIKSINTNAVNTSGTALTTPIYGTVTDDGTGANWEINMKIKINLGGDKGLKLDGTDTIEVSKTFAIAGVGDVVENETYRYNCYEKIWLKNETGIDYTDLGIVSVSDIQQVTGNKMFVVTFDRDIIYGSAPMLNAESAWLRALSNSANPVLSYSDGELDSYITYGVQDSLRDKIKINGKTVWDLMISDNILNNKNVTIIESYGSDGPNALSISFNDTGTNAVDLTKSFDIEFLAGFVTPLGGKLSENYKFTYDPAKGAFSGSSGTIDISTPISNDYPTGLATYPFISISNDTNNTVVNGSTDGNPDTGLHTNSMIILFVCCTVSIILVFGSIMKKRRKVYNTVDRR